MISCFLTLKTGTFKTDSIFNLVRVGSFYELLIMLGNE